MCGVFILDLLMKESVSLIQNQKTHLSLDELYSWETHFSSTTVSFLGSLRKRTFLYTFLKFSELHFYFLFLSSAWGWVRFFFSIVQFFLIKDNWNCKIPLKKGKDDKGIKLLSTQSCPICHSLLASIGFYLTVALLNSLCNSMYCTIKYSFSPRIHKCEELNTIIYKWKCFKYKRTWPPPAAATIAMLTHWIWCFSMLKEDHWASNLPFTCTVTFIKGHIPQLVVLMQTIE